MLENRYFDNVCLASFIIIKYKIHKKINKSGFKDIGFENQITVLRIYNITNFRSFIYKK